MARGWHRMGRKPFVNELALDKALCKSYRITWLHSDTDLERVVV